jgi:Ca2+-transporting ATPase
VPPGLTSDEAATRLAADGRNEIARARATPRWRVLLRQMASPLVALLVAAGAASLALGEIADAIAIGAIVVINAIVGFVQEDRATRAVLALRSMTAPRARVLRDGGLAVIPAAEVVRGDVLVLEAGDLVAADARLLEAHALSVNEAPLTGESMPAAKSIAPAAPDAPLAERTDHVFLGTSVATGTGQAEVTAVGMSTELGRVARLLATAEPGPTPLQVRLARVGRMLLVASVAIVAVVAVLGLARGGSLFQVFLTGVSLAVAAVPEGLPAIVTIALAVGVQRMAARHALIRRIAAVETLGCSTVICTDKTGTLTTGVMTVRDLTGDDERRLLDAAAACCDAELGAGVGDPTELAILAAAARRGIDRAEIERDRPRVEVEPFDPQRKQMSIRRADGIRYVKGAFEAVAPRCTAGAIATIGEAVARMGAAGLRVLAVAAGHDERLELLGAVGIADPPRPEAIDAIAVSRAAGISTVMITGDHPATAQAIAREMGIDAANVHARATPEDKLRLVRAWKERGAVVAMTGDGVNDAPALREAHVGIAMGRTGTEVTREAADVVLADDDFASIVAAVEEGRAIFENIRKTLVYLLSGNAAELAIMLIAALLGMPLPLLPLQLLWINLVTDGLPALALVTDPKEPGLMARPPRRPDEPMLGRTEWWRVLVTAAVEATVVLVVFGVTLAQRDLATARTLAFSTLVFSELFRAFAARSASRLLWEVGALRNVRLIAVVALSALSQLAIHELAFTRALFDVGPLALIDAAVAVGAGLVAVSLLEISKLVVRALGTRGGGTAPSVRTATIARRQA